MPIVGHSLGGITAAYVSQRRPDLAPALFMEDPPLFFGDKAVFDATAFAVVFPLMQAAIKGWQAEGASAEQIAAAMAAAAVDERPGDDGRREHARRAGRDGHRPHAARPVRLRPVLSGESLGKFDPAVPIPAPGVLLQPDRELGRGVLRRPRRRGSRR